MENDKKIPLRVLDLFSGIGGFSYALERLCPEGAFRTIAFCEREPYCQAVLRKHWPNVPIYDDVRTIPTDELGRIDLICGGFPCQPWSVAGEQRGAEDDRDLWPVMASLIEKLQPQWVIGENVQGFVSQPMGLQRSLSDLARLGYQAAAFVIPACATKAPHIRNRVWIIAHAHGHGQSDGTVNEEQRRGELVGNTKRSRFSGVNRRGSGKEPKNRCADVAHADSTYPQGSGLSGGIYAQHADTDGGSSPTRTIKNVADAERRGRQGSRQPVDAINPTAATVGEAVEPVNGGFREIGCAQSRMGGMADGVPPWLDEPDIGRVATGVKNRARRLKALGNAVVPQVVAEIGKAILSAVDE
jgi:DNA (cytosine-5)-methyltransferase 1